MPLARKLPFKGGIAFVLSKFSSEGHLHLVLYMGRAWRNNESIPPLKGARGMSGYKH
jgi:hypothetical protein